MASGSRWRGLPKAAVTVLPVALLAGCGTDPVGTPVAWWHQLQGGAIAAQRPPPPGVDAPYPHVGTTPAAPAVPSIAVRTALTDTLIRQRYASARADAENPLVAPAPAGKPATAAGASSGPPAPGAAAPGIGETSAAASPATSTATLAAVAATPAASSSVAGSSAPPNAATTTGPLLALPAAPSVVTDVAAGPPPTMPASPPAAPSFPGFAVPTTSVPPLRPDFGAPPPADLAFQPASDVLLASARGALVHVVTSRGAGRIRVIGYGDAMSDAPDDQAAALRLGLARAASAARALEQMGVPSRAIVVAARAFGRGGDVSVIP